MRQGGHCQDVSIPPIPGGFRHALKEEVRKVPKMQSKCDRDGTEDRRSHHQAEHTRARCKSEQIIRRLPPPLYQPFLLRYRSV